MFREMRRKKQLLPKEETDGIISRATCMVVGVIGDDGYPYTFPISHAFDEENGKLYFHSAKEGHKIDAVKNNPKVSFAIVDKDEIVSAAYTTYFRSVQGFGKAYIVEDEEERNRAFELIARKFCKDDMGRFDSVMEKEAPLAAVVAVDIEHVTGKEAIELTKMR